MRRFRPVVVAGGLIALALGSAGCATPRVARPDTIPHSAYRPAFSDAPPRRTLFLGGYAGYNYGPIATETQVPTAAGGEVWGYPAARPSFRWRLRDFIP